MHCGEVAGDEAGEGFDVVVEGDLFVLEGLEYGDDVFEDGGGVLLGDSGLVGVEGLGLLVLLVDRDFFVALEGGEVGEGGDEDFDEERGVGGGECGGEEGGLDEFEEEVEELGQAV